MAGYPPTPPPPGGPPGPPQGPYGPQGQPGYPPQGPYGPQQGSPPQGYPQPGNPRQPYGPPGGGPPPGYGGPVPPPPNQPPQRRNGLLIVGIAGGVAALVVVGVTTWALLRPSAPYSSLGDCDELLSEDVLAGIRGAEDNEVEQFDHYEGGGMEDSDYEEVRQCFSEDDLDDPLSSGETFISLSVYRHAADTEEDDYADVRRQMERDRDDLYDSYEIDLEDGEGTVTPSGTSAEMVVRRISTGDGGDVFSIDDPNRDMAPMHETGRWGNATFITRNLEVHIQYSGTRDVSADEHREIVVDLADTINRQLSRTGETE